MNAGPRNRRVWKLLAIPVVGVAIAIPLIALKVRSVAAERWAAMETRLRALEADEPAPSISRRVIRGEPLPGNAWDDYLAAVAEIRTLKDWSHLSSYTPTRNSSHRDLLEKILDAHPDIIPRFRTGTRRA